VTTVATSSVLDDVAEKLGGEVVCTRVGEPEIIEYSKKSGGDIGGEENGGVIFFDRLPVRDDIFTAVKLVKMLAGSDMKISELNATLPRCYQSKQRIRCPDERKLKVLKALEKRFEGCELDRIDGLRVVTDDGWLLLRLSGTEPIFRCFAEARAETRAKELADLGMRELMASIKATK
jgi:phosphomannomutase/phosphoglucomutase